LVGAVYLVSSLYGKMGLRIIWLFFQNNGIVIIRAGGSWKVSGTRPNISRTAKLKSKVSEDIFTVFSD